MRTILLIILANVLYFVWEFCREERARSRKRNFEAVRIAAMQCARAGWVTTRLTWHGLWRTQPRMELWHPDRLETWVLKLS